MLVKILSTLEHDGVRYRPSSAVQSVKGLSCAQADRLVSKGVIAPNFELEKEADPAAKKEADSKKKDKE